MLTEKLLAEVYEVESIIKFAAGQRLVIPIAPSSQEAVIACSRGPIPVVVRPSASPDLSVYIEFER